MTCIVLEKSVRKILNNDQYNIKMSVFEYGKDATTKNMLHTKDGS